MPDPALLHLPNGEFVVADLSDLRRKLPAEVRSQLDTGRASTEVAGVLWSRTYDSYEQRQFFSSAVRQRSGFDIQRIDPLRDALQWLQRSGAVARWYDDDGVPHLRVSVHDDEDDVLVVVRRLHDDAAGELVAAVDALQAELAVAGSPRRLHVVRDDGSPDPARLLEEPEARRDRWMRREAEENEMSDEVQLEIVDRLADPDQHDRT